MYSGDTCLHYLHYLVQEPGHGLQLELGNVVIDGLQEDAEVWVRTLHSREEIRDDALKQRDVLEGVKGSCDLDWDSPGLTCNNSQSSEKPNLFDQTCDIYSDAMVLTISSPQ